MIDLTTLITYVAILSAFVIIPGPAVLLTLARATTSGTRVGLATGLGIAVGDLTHTVIAVVGISSIVMASATLFAIIKYLGAAYLIYLGIKAILDSTMTDQSIGSSNRQRLSTRVAFRQAVLTEVLNPKSAMFFLAFLSQFLKPENGAVWLQLMQLGILFVLLGLLTTVATALFAGHLGAQLNKNPLVVKYRGIFTGSVYCALGIRVSMQNQ